MSITRKLMARVRELLLEDFPEREPCAHQLQFWADKRNVDITGRVTSVTGVFIEDLYCEGPDGEVADVYVTVHIVEMDAVNNKIDEDDIRKVSISATSIDRAARMLRNFTEALEAGREPCDEDSCDEADEEEPLVHF